MHSECFINMLYIYTNTVRSARLQGEGGAAAVRASVANSDFGRAGHSQQY